jgi:biotin carboxyl carrier protein
MAEEVRAHITGVVFQIVAGAGSALAAGDPILILESMKMEIPVEAPRAGTVREVRVTEGQTVQEGEVVATLE